jgi:hypothetical protein
MASDSVITLLEAPFQGCSWPLAGVEKMPAVKEQLPGIGHLLAPV